MILRGISPSETWLDVPREGQFRRRGLCVRQRGWRRDDGDLYCPRHVCQGADPRSRRRALDQAPAEHRHPSDSVLSLRLFWAVCIGVFALLPASLFIVAGEILGIRNRFYYAATASFVAVVVYLIPLYPAVGYGPREMLSIEAIMYSVSGVVAGLVYWGFAGRDAECRLRSLGFGTGPE